MKRVREIIFLKVFICMTRSAGVSVVNPASLEFLQEEAARRNVGKKKQTSKDQQAVPAFVFAVEQHHHELQKLSKKIELGDISTPAAARDFR